MQAFDQNTFQNNEALARYLSGEMTAEEKSFFLQHVSHNSEDLAMLKHLQQQWDLLSPHKTFAPDTDKAWDKMAQRIAQDNLVPENKPTQVRRLYPTPVLRWAAAIILMIATGALTYMGFQGRQLPMLSLQTSNDSITLVQTLHDGTVVYLADNTQLSYPQTFKAGSRKVSLQGEAFFDVTPNPQQPFRIETPQAFIDVLGTSFNVKTNATHQLELFVEEGTVRVSPRNSRHQPMLVEAGELLIIQNGQPQKQKAPELYQAPWRIRHMQFKDEPLKNILSVIGKNFKAKFHVMEEELNERRLTVTFHNTSLPVITELISLSLNLDYRIEPDSSIVFMSHP